MVSMGIGAIRKLDKSTDTPHNAGRPEPPAMNALPLPEVLLEGAQPTRQPSLPTQPSLPLATEGVQRYVWQSAFGPILIEARDGVAFVNGQRVMSMAELRGADAAS